MQSSDLTVISLVVGLVSENTAGCTPIFVSRDTVHAVRARGEVSIQLMKLNNAVVDT